MCFFFGGGVYFSFSKQTAQSVLALASNYEKNPPCCAICGEAKHSQAPTAFVRLFGPLSQLIRSRVTQGPLEWPLSTGVPLASGGRSLALIKNGPNEQRAPWFGPHRTAPDIFIISALWPRGVAAVQQAWKEARSTEWTQASPPPPEEPVQKGPFLQGRTAEVCHLRGI